MPTPAFVPIIGSGFDQIGAQQSQWAGFNASQDAQNRAAAQAQDRAANDWFSRLAQMQSQENERRDQMDQRAQDVAARQAELASGRSLQQQQSAESKRQFDVTSGREAEKFQWQKDSTADADEKQKAFDLDMAETSVPHIDEAGKAHDAALKAVTDATTKFNAGASEWASQIPGSRWNPSSNQLEKTMMGKAIPFADPKDQAIAAEAAADMAQRKADLQNAIATHKEVQSNWQSALARLPKGLTPIKDEDGNWGIRAPQWKMSFFPKQKPKADPTPTVSDNGFVPASVAGWAQAPTPAQLAASSGAPSEETGIPSFIPQDTTSGTMPSPVAALSVQGGSGGWAGWPPLSPPTTPPMAASALEVPTLVSSQAQFDALPPGAIYIGKNGKKYQKPYAQDERQ